MNEHGQEKVVPFPAVDPEKARDIRRKVEARAAEEDAKYGGGGDGPTVDSRFVRDCLKLQGVGDGHMYVALNKGDYLYSHTTDEWYGWTGHHWRLDMRKRSLVAVERVAQRHQEEAAKVYQESQEEEGLKSTYKELRKRVNSLRKKAGLEACREMSTRVEGNHSIDGDEQDANPYLVACANGVIDLRDGELRPGRQDDYLTKACAVAYDPDAACPAWEAFLDDMFQGTEDAIPCEFIRSTATAECPI